MGGVLGRTGIEVSETGCWATGGWERIDWYRSQLRATGLRQRGRPGRVAARRRPPSAEEAMDITQLILDDHHEQRRLFAILEQVGRADTGTLEAVWARLSAFLEVHAAAEEAIFYPELLRAGIRTGGKGTAEEETLDAIHDHNDIRDAIALVAEHVTGSDEWFAAVA